MTATATATGLKAIITTDVFHAALSTAKKVVKTNSPIPILQCVRITAAGGEVRLFTTNNEASVIADIDAVDVHIEGKAMIPCHKLHQIISRISDPTFTLEVDEKHHATISTSTATFKVYGYPPQDGPKPVEEPDGYSHTMPADTFRQYVTIAKSCAAINAGKFAIVGINLCLLKDGGVRIVSMDGRRMAMLGPQTGEEQISEIASPTIAMMAQSLDEGDGVHIHIDTEFRRVWVRSGNIAIATQAVDAKFPPYLDFIPKNETVIVKIDTEKFRDSVATAGVMRNDDSRGVVFSWSHHGLELSGRTPEMGETTVQCEIENYTGDPLKIVFDPSHLLAWLGSLDGELTLKMSAHNKPMLTLAGTDCAIVVMPINL